MSNLKRNLIVGVAGLAVTGTGYLLNQFLKGKKHQQKQYKPVCTLIGDVGGTNIRFQLVVIQPPHDKPQKIYKKKTYPVTQYQHFINAIKDFLADVQDYPKVAVIGIAGPVADNKVRMANVPKWNQLDGNFLGQQLNIKDFKFINDFEANSYGLLLLNDEDFISVNGKEMMKQKTIGVMGPGTGLGVSVLYTSAFRKRQRVYVLPSQGGHTDFCHIDEQTSQFFQFMKQKTGHKYISRQRSFCGPAIPYMFQFYAKKFPELEDSQNKPTSQQIINKCRQQIQNQNSEKSLYFKTLNLFIKLYSSAIGNFMAHHMCTGGMYLVGGLTNAILPFIQGKNLIEAYLQRHHEIASTLEKIPIVVSKQIDLGLKGAFVIGRRIISDEQHE